MKTAQMKVELVDRMGTDLTVVNAARVSFDKASSWEFYDDGTFLGAFRISDKDAKLINYLAKHNHWSPFAHTSIQLRVKAPIFVARQLVKHQVGGVWNEVSRRYVDSEPEFYMPNELKRRPDGSIKQGAGDVHEDSLFWVASMRTVLPNLIDLYNDMIEAGVAPEQARMILPQNMMVEWIWTGSLMFFTRVCRERLHPKAQAETREIAEQIAEIVAPLFPVSWSALIGETK